MKQAKRTTRVIGAIMLLALIVAGILWGPDAYYGLRYRYHETIDLPDGAGRVTFIAFRGEDGKSLAFHRDPKKAFSGASGRPPLRFTFEENGTTYTFLFPGAESAERTGGPAYTMGPAELPNEEMYDMLRHRHELYPELDWSTVFGDLPAGWSFGE